MGDLVADEPTLISGVPLDSREMCRRALLGPHYERVVHFLDRLLTQHSTEEFVVVVLNVEHVWGGRIAERMMPGYDWNAIRATHQIPYARGVVRRHFMQGALEIIDRDAAARLHAIAGPAIVIMDYYTAAAFSPDEVALGTCRRCVECVGCRHHWIDNLEFEGPMDPVYACKHCDAVCDEIEDDQGFPIPDEASARMKASWVFQDQPEGTS